jgi:hypothetical protein
LMVIIWRIWFDDKSLIFMGDFYSD